MRRRIAHGLMIGLLVVGLGAAQGPNNSEASSAPSRSAQIKPGIQKQAGKTKPFQVGTASWYGEYFDGKPTASGEDYDMYDMTAAHPDASLGKLCAGDEPAQRTSGGGKSERSRTDRGGPDYRPFLRSGAGAAIPAPRLATGETRPGEEGYIPAPAGLPNHSRQSPSGGISLDTLDC